VNTHQPTTPIIDFYRGASPDARGRMLRDILQADDAWLERTHDYIQWLFPLRTRSAFNTNAPTLDDATVAAFGTDTELRGNLARAFGRMLRFYGFEEQRDQGAYRIVPASNAAAQQRNWLTPGNHNFLRITRILTSLDTLGLPAEARAFFAALDAVYVMKKDIIGATTYRFWRDAVRA
jgi:hypothetical protein